MSTFQSRMKAAMRQGSLTIADLESWFSRPHATVWRWVHSGWEPGLRYQSTVRDASGVKAEKDLVRLEKALLLNLFPVPPHISSRLRRDYIRNVYHAAYRARLPQARAAE